MTVAGENGAGGFREGVLRRAFSAGAGKLSWDLGSRVLSFALSILVARRLGAEGFGTYAVYWYSAWMVSQATDLGLHLVSLRSLSRSFEPRIFWSAVLAKSALTAGVLVATLIALGAGALSAEEPLLLWLLAAQLLGSWIEFLGVTLRSRGGIAREGLVLTVLRFASLAAAAWALSGGADLESLAEALALSCLPALALALALLARIDLPFRGGTEAGRLMKEAFPLGLVSAMTLLYLRADLFIVAAVAGASEAGFFQSAFRLFEATFVVSGGLAAGTFPLLAARFGEKGFDALARFVLGLLVLLSAPIALAFVLVPGPILTFLYGGGFDGAARPLSLLGVALVAVFINALTTHLLVASARNRCLVLSIATRLVAGIVLDLVLVPRWGATGAAIAVAAAEWSLLLVSLVFSADLLGLSLLSRRGVPREPSQPSKEVSPCA
jgi:O-antigen/teichoic acid export membrane protein